MVVFAATVGGLTLVPFAATTTEPSRVRTVTFMKSATRKESTMKAITTSGYVRLVTVFVLVATAVLVFAAVASASRSI